MILSCFLLLLTLGCQSEYAYYSIDEAVDVPVTLSRSGNSLKNCRISWEVIPQVGDRVVIRYEVR